MRCQHAQLNSDVYGKTFHDYFRTTENGKKEMFKRLRDAAETVTAGKMIFRLVRLYCSTFRLTIENESEWIDHYLHRGTF